MRPKKDDKREHRIIYEIVVDCYDEYERASGWWCYLDDMLKFPFKAKCIQEHSISFLKKGEIVTVLHIADQDDCESEMFVIVEFKEHEFGVPLIQLQPIDSDDQTVEAIEDWRYWVNQGYTF